MLEEGEGKINMREGKGKSGKREKEWRGEEKRTGKVVVGGRGSGGWVIFRNG